MSGQDISAELGGLIADGNANESSDNIRHGIYKFLIKTIRSDLVEVEKGHHKFVFWELQPLDAQPNPQVEGDRVDYVSPTQPGTGPLKDPGTSPNMVGSDCALKIDFDGAGARNAPGNAQKPIYALFNRPLKSMSKEELAATWIDLSRKKDIRKGEPCGFDSKTNSVVYADKDKRAQPARGMVIGCRTSVKRKKEPNEKGAYVTILSWFCIAPIGTGENSAELVAARRAEIEKTIAPDSDDDDETAPTGNGTQMPVGAGGPPSGGMQVPATPPQSTMAPPPPGAAAPPPPSAPWAPPAPWRPHTDPKYFGTTPETRFYWDGGQGVKSEVQLRAGQ